MKKILGIGNALVDILVHIDNDEILNRLGLQKGGMEMIDAQRKREILEVISGMPQTLATGGSTSNTIHGLARLGAEAGYIGKVGNDEMGQLFREGCTRFGVIPHLIESKEDTGVAITFISSNAERTFATYLGAAATMQPNEVDEQILDNYDIIHIEGYLIFNHDLILSVCQKAKEHGLQISMDATARLCRYHLRQRRGGQSFCRCGKCRGIARAVRILSHRHREGRQRRFLHQDER